MSGSNPFLSVLGHTPISKVLSPTKVVYLTPESTLAQFLAVADEHKIISVPVMDADFQVLGVMGVIDAVRFLVSRIPNVQEVQDGDFTNIAASGVELSDVQIKDILQLGGASAYLPTVEINPISYLLEVFASGVHRACVFRDVKDQQRPLSICSQTDVLRVLCDHLEANEDIKDLSSRTLKDLGLAADAPIFVKENVSMIVAFGRMVEKKVRSLVVVDESGKAIGNLSASDLKGNFARLSSEFSLSVREFLQKHRPSSLELKPLQMDATLAQIMNYLVRENRHRCWIVDNLGVPVGVVSLTDIMKLVVYYKYERLSHFVISLPAELTIHIVEARNLMVGDILSSDPYVVTRIPQTEDYRTQTIWNTLNPKWSGEIISWLIDETNCTGQVTLRIMDENKRNPDGHLGTVTLDIPWILNGFGTFQYLPSFDDWFQIENAQQRGQIHLVISVAEK